LGDSASAFGESLSALQPEVLQRAVEERYPRLVEEELSIDRHMTSKSIWKYNSRFQDNSIKSKIAVRNATIRESFSAAIVGWKSRFYV
jgi:F0F1-type ATP synthase delta subunit